MLSQHFSVAEFTASQTAARLGLSNAPPEHVLHNLKRLAATMQQVRCLLDNRPILISSGYRSPEVNLAVGGSHLSAHTLGLACDFTCPGFGSPRQVCHVLQHHLAVLGIDQLILEYGDWVHLGLSTHQPRHQLLTIDRSGTHYGFA